MSRTPRDGHRVGLRCGHAAPRSVGHRQHADRGVLAGKQPGEKVGKPSADQPEIARLRRDLAAAERKLATTETALMGTYRELTEAGVTTRTAAGLTGVPRATAARRPEAPSRRRRAGRRLRTGSARPNSSWCGRS